MPSTQTQQVALVEAQIQLDQASLNHKLQALKNLGLDDAVVNLYVTKISTSNKEKRFVEVKRLNVHSDDKPLFKNYVTECIDGNEHICELKSINTTQDNRFFYVEKSATDFSQMEALVTTGQIDFVTEKSELNSFNSYVIQLTFGEPEQSIFAFRYISGAWSANKTSGKFFGFNTFNNELIVKIKEDPRFQITPYIDFLQYGDDIFIADIKQFETAMNFHERLKEKKVEAITALCASSAMLEVAKEPLTRVIGNDKYLMRQLASVHEKGHFADDIWLAKLKIKSEAAGNWKIKFDDSGKIIIDETKDYVKEVLTLLQNKRVITVVDEKMFDVDGEFITPDFATTP
ncbi:Kiwa anti-phage protein KwaB-like domain-containing protein [Shewanella sp. 1180_01]|uniref:Kiwa anti-phage protein KwaB-like domain-containing protein n=1 Tax=Shewanella sp. 1180_01 TaxID=2604451 RepID=UPI004062FDA1